MNRLLYLFLALLAVSKCFAQRSTIIDDAGDTVVVTPSTQAGYAFTITLSTITAPLTTPTTEKKTTSTSPQSTSSTATFTDSIPKATAMVPSGTIAGYSTYQSAVNGYLESLSASQYAAYTATARTSGSSRSFDLINSRSMVRVVLGASAGVTLLGLW